MFITKEEKEYIASLKPAHLIRFIARHSERVGECEILKDYERQDKEDEIVTFAEKVLIEKISK